MKYSLVASLLLTCVFLVSPALAQQATVTTASLVREMIDLDRLATLSGPSYKTVQFSSYDRRADLPNGRDWFANADGFGREPIPGVVKVLQAADKSKEGKYLLADVEGPGALVRLWTASHNRETTSMNGRIRMYLDNAKQPMFDGSAQDFLLSLYPALAEQHGLPTTDLTAGFAQRDAGYYPLPFAKRCRIEWIGRLDRVHFYHIEFRKYAPGTQVQSFHPKDLKNSRTTIKQVGSVLAKPSSQAAALGEVISLEANLEPNKYCELLHIQHRPGKIAQLVLKLEAKDMSRALRQTVLTIFFDHHSRPQVEAPLGDFFAAAPGINPFECLPMQVAPDGTMTCRFVMPFKERAHMWVVNRGKQQVKLQGEVVVSNYQWKESKSMHFYAQWRVNHGMLIEQRRGFDIPFVLARGTGRFVGCSVHLMNPSNVPTGNWWGEGDEKIFVDDDVQPSFFGTGSEDYFNYSWSVPDLFTYAYFAQPRCDGPSTRGFVVNNRWHILDDIPFQRRLDFFMEMLHHMPTEGFTYARISYYYGRPGIISDQMPIFPADLRPPFATQNWEPLTANRQSNATYVQCEAMPSSDPMPIENDPFWSLGKRRVWKPSKENDTNTLLLEAPKAGKYRLSIVMSQSPEAGVFGLKWNDRLLTNSDGTPWKADLYTPFHTQARHYTLPGKLEFHKGKNRLTLVSFGKNPQSKGNQIGADFLWYQP